MRYRGETTALATNDSRAAGIARAWNACVDEIPRMAPATPDRATRQAAHDDRVGELSRRTAGGDRTLSRRVQQRSAAAPGASASGPAKQSTIDTRRRELQAFARMAVRSGASRSKASPRLRRCSIPAWSRKFSTPTGRTMERSPASTPSIWPGSSFRRPGDQVPSGSRSRETRRYTRRYGGASAAAASPKRISRSSGRS